MSETVNVTYTGAAPVIVPDVGIVAEPGKSYEIPTELAASLLDRDWVKAEKKAAKESES